MCDPQDVTLAKRHSFYENSCKESIQSGTYCKSDANLSNESVTPDLFKDLRKNGAVISSENSGCGEYYRCCEHDSVSCDVTSTESGKGEGIPITESHLATLERNISQELPTGSSASTLESNVKFFRNTVEEIFDKFYANMLDFERYKKRYQEILSRNREDTVEEMEEFIKNMIHHIMSSESAAFNESRLRTVTDKGTGVSSGGSAHSLLRNLHSVVEAFKNENYLTDSTADERGLGPNDKRKSRKEMLSVYVMSGNPCVKIKTNDRKLLSEINLTDSRADRECGAQAASAEDIRKVAAKKLALELYERQAIEMSSPSGRLDRDIPVKTSYPKKNIHLDQDFDRESGQTERSFISRICSYLCKRLRKTSIA